MVLLPAPGPIRKQTHHNNCFRLLTAMSTDKTYVVKEVDFFFWAVGGQCTDASWVDNMLLVRRHIETAWSPSAPVHHKAIQIPEHANPCVKQKKSVCFIHIWGKRRRCETIWIHRIAAILKWRLLFDERLIVCERDSMITVLCLGWIRMDRMMTKPKSVGSWSYCCDPIDVPITLLKQFWLCRL